MRDFDVLEWRRLPGTERASNPFWSPDGRHLGFVADNTVKKIDLAGGPPETVATLPEIPLEGGTWNRTGDIARRLVALVHEGFRRTRSCAR